MTNSRLRTSVAAAASLLVLLACAVPGLSPASLPAPTADTVFLVTMVAETVAAARAETETAMPVPTSTPTLPPPTEKPTTTPETEASASGSLLTKRDDGSTIFADQRPSYEVILPVGWLPVRVNEQEYEEAWTLAETTDPAIQAALQSIETEDPNQLRLFVLDTQDGHIQAGVVTTIRFEWDEQDDMSLADEVDLVALSEALPAESPGLEVLTTELRRTPSGLPIGVITSRTPTVTSDGNTLILYQEQVFVDLPQGTLTITLSTTEGFIDVAVPAFEGMIETLAVVN
ncbi:MAG: hypothetical protein AB1649_12045 [Chloroflexota bacterium]